MNVSPEQVKAARVLLSWSQEELAGHAGLSAPTVGHFETGRRRISAPSLSAIRGALEAAGVEFTNGSQPGVSMKSAIVFEVAARQSGEPFLKGYDKDKIVIVEIDRGVFAGGGSAPLRCESANAAIVTLGEIANRKYAEQRSTGRPATLVITEADISLAGDVSLG